MNAATQPTKIPERPTPPINHPSKPGQAIIPFTLSLAVRCGNVRARLQPCRKYRRASAASAAEGAFQQRHTKSIQALTERYLHGPRSLRRSALCH